MPQPLTRYAVFLEFKFQNPVQARSLPFWGLTSQT